jgi:hypothetical protein
MILVVVVLLAVCIGMPLAYAWRIWRLSERSRIAWLLVVADSAVFVALVMLVGRWDIAGYYTRFALLALLGMAAIFSWLRHARLPWLPANGPSVWRQHWPTAGSLALFGAALVYVLLGLRTPADTRELAFPLQGGTFVVGQGGGITLLNHHAGHREQRYAADITAIGPAGFRAGGLLPENLDRYAIYDAVVTSPCDGKVLAVVDGLPDFIPPERDGENAAGNHVVLDCDGIEIELAHLREGSVAVASGAPVTVGAPVGRVGNSGNTTEPHLHIHAVDPRTRTGVAITFDGRFPVRNRIYRN